jgi:superfamily II DNA/RNA helicase
MMRVLLLLNLAPVRTFVQVASRRQIRGVMRPSAPTESEDVGPWRRLGLSDEMHHALNGMGLREPSPIQQQAIPQLMTGENLLVASETGSGKTLGYLLPIIQALRAAEALGTVRQVKRPRALVLVPTRELADQVLAVTKSIGHVAKVASCAVMGGDGDFARQKRSLAGVVDVVVASPGRLLKHRKLDNVHLSQITHVVIDEVDTMLTQGFGPDIEQLISPLTRDGGKEGVQLVLTTATVTKAVRALLEKDFPPVRMIESPRLHRTVDTLQHDMVDTTGRDKLVVLLETLQVRPGARTLLFCNTVSSCRAVEHYLSEQRFPSLSYHGELNSAERRENIATFKAGDVAVLVCTDLAARGLDMPVVSHVIMFDFPLNPIDYLHRAGRTARMGSDGLVTALVAKRDRVLATAIDRAIGKGLPLDSLTSNKADYVAGKGRLANVVSVNARPSARSSTNRHARSSSAPSRASTRARNLHDRWAAQESLQEKKKARLAERRRKMSAR